MFIGQFGLAGLVAYGPWFPQGGDTGVFCCDVIGLTTDARVDVSVQHKNRTDADGSATVAASFTQIATAGVAVKEAGGLKELVRYKVTISSDTGMTNDDWAIFDVMTPTWKKN